MSTALVSETNNHISLTRQFLLFSQGASLFAVDLVMVREVISPLEQFISAIPNTQKFLLGLMNLRGEILAVADFGQFTNSNVTDLNHAQSRILVLETTNPQNIRALPIRLGLAVSQVQGVLSLYPDQVVSAAEACEDLTPFLRGLYDCEGRLLMILDVEAIIQSDRW
jgi:purine-binding chemotaxis protein CheW